MEVNQQGFSKILNNADIMIHIYEMLNFLDQLRLSRASVMLQRIFEEFVWTDNYRRMTITKRPPNLIVTNEMKMRRLSFDLQEFEEFINVYGEGVQELSEICYAPVSYCKFPNLTSLTYHHMVVAMCDFEIIAACCPLLEVFHLYLCTQADDGECITIGQPWHIKPLLQMKNLKSLKVLGADEIVTLKYRHFLAIIERLEKLECLQLTASIESDQSVAASTTRRPLRELQIAASFDSRKWGKNFAAFLRNFETLEILSLQLQDRVTDNTLQIISDTCQNLQDFHIRLTTFTDIESFPLALQLRELSLYRCEGLTHVNLRELLRQCKITKFSSRETSYQGTFADFHISPSLQSLQVDALDMTLFKSAYEANANLRQLVWYDPSETRPAVPPAFGVNLEILDIQKGFIPVDVLLQLASLRKLTICAKSPSLKWSHLRDLLQHPSLRELIIGAYWQGGELAMVADIPIQGFFVNLVNVKVHLRVFEMAMDFWLDLFRQNCKLKLIVYCTFMWSEQFIKDIVNNKYFPRDLRTICMCGFHMKCQDLRRNFDDVILKYYQQVCYVNDIDLILYRE